MNTHLVIGASGLVGGCLVQAVSASGYEVLGTYCSVPLPGLLKLDVRNPPSVRRLLLEARPSAVYLPASLTNVDYCELHPQEGYATNVEGVTGVVQMANEVGAKLVYFSSDYIFDGTAGPYRENAPANPICEYGRQKLIAEHFVALHAHDYLIVRTAVVYGWERQEKNFIHRLLNTLKAGGNLKVPADQIGSPTYAPNLAQAVVELVRANARGVYNVVGPEVVNRYLFACEAAYTLGLDPGLIQGVSTEDLQQAARRPLNAGLVAEKASAQITTPLMGYLDGLRAMLAERDEEHLRNKA